MPEQKAAIHMAHSINPHAKQQPLGDSGPYDTSYPPRIVWHTTEGDTYPGPQLYHGTNPHFTCDFKRKKLYQHTPIDLSAKALVNGLGGVETNHANAVQVELVGRAAQSGTWSDEDYAFIHELARWIEDNHNVRHHAADPWTQPRFSQAHWRRFAGHCGHMHVPENDHTDPGMAFHHEQVI
jgi:hypothetical protein